MESITLQTNDSIISSGDSLGQLQFAASAESDGGASRLVGARIYAQGEGAFNASSNPASLVFATSDADNLPASGKIKISHDGHILPLKDNSYDLGSESLRFRNLYVASGIHQTGVFDVISFNTDIEPDLLKGQMSWNDTEGTVNIALTDTVDIHIGEHSFFRVRNETGNVLYKGQVVYASGVHANGIILPDLYSADGTIREVRFMGFMLENLNNNNNGYAIQFGHIKELDTRGNVASNIAVGDETWADGDILYVHPTVPGKLTKVEPKHSIIAAIILDAASNGSIFVRPTSYGHLSDNHDVGVSGLVDNNFLVWNSGLDTWEPSSGLYYVNDSLGIGTSSPNATLHAYSDTPSGTVFNVEGTNGSLFSVVDNLSGVLMSVNTIAGLPVFQVNSDYSIVGGRFNQNDFVITTSGDIGMGTANPTQQLDVRYPVGGGMALLKSTDTTDGLLFGDIYSPNNTYQGIKHAAMGGANDYMMVSDGTNTYISAAAGYNTTILGGGNNSNSQITLKSTEVVINDNSSSLDFRVESNNNANMFFVDGVTDMVGIGTGSPATPLHVIKGSSTQTLRVDDYTAGQGLSQLANFTNNSDADLVVYLTNVGATTKYSMLQSSVANRNLVLNGSNNGNVGIGITSPTSKLHVAGDGNITGNVIVGGNLTILGTTVTADVDRMEVEDPIITLGLASGNVVTDTNLDRGLALTRSNGLTAFMGWDTSENEFSLLSSGIAQNSSGNYIPGTYGNLHIGGLIATTANFSSTIDAANLGAGEDNSVVILDSDGKLRTDEIDSRVWGTSLVDGGGVAGHVAFWTDNNTLSYDSNQLVWDSTNNRLGIGTGTPATNLHVYGGASGQTASGIAGLFVENNGTSNGNYVFQTATAIGKTFSITNAGNVGIGITAPSGTLHVVGDAYVDNLKLDGNTLSTTDTNGALILNPNGTGALQADSGGNARGAYAVDLQRVRSVDTEVASGGCSVISGGRRNIASGDESVIGGGIDNCTIGLRSTVGGGYLNRTQEEYSTIGGGICNTVNTLAYRATIAGGSNNFAGGSRSTVGGGLSNTVSGTYSTISGGSSNITNARHSIISGGHRNIIQSPTNECCSRGVTIGGGVGHNSSGGTLNATTGNLTGAITCCNAGAFSTISGGLRNCATGVSSTVGGGSGNTASGCTSTISGGCLNVAIGSYSAVSGGDRNCACASYSTVSGGGLNTTSSYYSAIGGGTLNVSSGNYSTISGGSNNKTNCFGASVGGGAINCANGAYSTVSGGYCNTASGNYSTISGGGGYLNGNTASGYASTISGGKCNCAYGDCSVVSGGFNNISCGLASVVNGGSGNTANGVFSSVGGGSANIASGACSTVAGGFSNCATGLLSFIGGGTNNSVTVCTRSAIGGGELNSIVGSYGFIGGGLANCVSAFYGAVAGGRLNTAGSRAFVGGGRSNSASGIYSTVGGGCLNRSYSAYSSILGGCINTVCGTYATITGGYYNITNARHSTISGGHINVIQSPTNECCSRGATIGGGVGHNSSGGTLDGTTGDITGTITCCDAGAYSTIGGGLRNCATGVYSTVGGGLGSISCETGSTVGGGRGNTSSGVYSTVGGGYFNISCGCCSTVGGGRSNTSSGTYSTIGGGCLVVASGLASTVAGGRNNSACGSYATVSGGLSNQALATYATVSGGYKNVACSYGTVSGRQNTASGICSTISGGACSTASGPSSTIGGGGGNTVSGNYSTIGGGYANCVGGLCSIIGGGYANCVTGSFSAVSGGTLNNISSLNSSISGGCLNITSARHSTIAGGHYNVIQSPTNECCSRGATIGGGVGHNTTGGTVNATTGDITGTVACCNAGAFSTIGGGLRNIATSAYSVVSGGISNTASNGYASVGGGCANTAGGLFSVVAGGQANTVGPNSARGAILGGLSNCVYCNYSAVLGGRSNSVSSCYSSITGGNGNCILVNANRSVIGGGTGNCITGSHSSISGGYCNTSSGNYSSISGGCCNNDCGYANVHILGSSITATQANTTYTQNIISAGDVTITGHLSAATKSFLINHPIDKQKKLQYGSLESPYHGIRLTGKGEIKGGKCIVKLPDYISSLVRDDDNVNIQITNYRHSKTLYVDDIRIHDNEFVVKCDSWFCTNAMFFWSFTAVRKDVEELKVEF